MKVCVLSSGSKGNCTYIETKNHKILIDIGTTSLNIEKKLRANNIEPDSIDAILITHTHVDHVSGLKVFSKKYSPVVYMTEKMEKELSFTPDNLVNIVGEINLDELRIIPIKISHDVEDANGYIVEDNNSSLVYITDTGYVNEKYHDLLKNKNAYIFESNHDVEKLMNNPNYPHYTKIRILSDKGHLSNKDSSIYLAKLIGPSTHKILLMHLSRHNNTEEIALSTIEETFKEYDVNFKDIACARQKEKSEVVEV